MPYSMSYKLHCRFCSLCSKVLYGRRTVKEAQIV